MEYPDIVPSTNIISLIRSDNFRITQKNETGNITQISCNNDQFQMQQLKHQNSEILQIVSNLKVLNHTFLQVANTLEEKNTVLMQTVSQFNQNIIDKLNDIMLKLDTDNFENRQIVMTLIQDSENQKQAIASLMPQNKDTLVTMVNNPDSDYDLIQGHGHVFGSHILRSDVISITIIDTLIDAPNNAWDISENKDKSIMAWCTLENQNYNLYIASDGIISLPKDCSKLFYGYTNLKTADLSKLNTFKVTNMDDMFFGCLQLTDLNISNWDTSSVTSMKRMFKNCSSLTNLNLSDWDVSNVIEVQAMFRRCSSLTDLNLSNWNTSNIIDMSYMFFSCSSLTNLNTSGWNVKNVIRHTQIFKGTPSNVYYHLSFK